jgi:hypothetical protein
VAKPKHTLPDKPFVAVLWHDPHSLHATEVVSQEDVHRLHRSLPMITNGYLLQEDEDGISVGSEYCGDGDYRGTTFVLRELITEIVYWPKLRRKSGVTGRDKRKRRKDPGQDVKADGGAAVGAESSSAPDQRSRGEDPKEETLNGESL